ncbi:orotidine 5'-phosphate decarboxylase / HUMPS family protein [Qaidamihabitans albus]|uniref:orotidine 5'-phosphate decarboxylase / HUMPS family protein n=1 Tax=Qaidamihabitans albus TaxID=2795733 RepID=UPI0018F24975|nr:orotidine 5'-phosphate decarboxylase / HUMPS family protein [Qaidamihabitans albus]
MIELQVALDRVELGHALAVTRAVKGTADWIEVGTSLVKRYGMAAVEAVALQADGAMRVLADLKTVDDAAHEFGLAFDAGATAATVLGLASPATLATATAVAGERGGDAVVDLMLLTEGQRADVAARTGPDVVLAAHVGKDDQATGRGPLDQLGSWAEGRRLAVAGGLGPADVPALRHVGRLRLIAGSAVTRADDPRAAVAALDAARRTEEE